MVSGRGGWWVVMKPKKKYEEEQKTNGEIICSKRYVMDGDWCGYEAGGKKNWRSPPWTGIDDGV